MTHHLYIFLKSDKSLYDLPINTYRTYGGEFLNRLKSNKHVTTYTYATLGLKVDTNILLWLQADSIDLIQHHLNMLLHTKLGRYLSITHSLFGMSRQTQYSSQSKGHLDTKRKGGSYLIIYPFTKTKDWYVLDFDSRRKLMGGHVGIGKKHTEKITQLLLYSYGIDDSEFIVSYETDDLSAFQTLVMELRTDKVRAFTQNDTPIFTCIYKTPKDVLTFL